jgi:hypothetical protein
MHQDRKLPTGRYRKEVKSDVVHGEIHNFAVAFACSRICFFLPFSLPILSFELSQYVFFLTSFKYFTSSSMRRENAQLFWLIADLFFFGSRSARPTPCSFASINSCINIITQSKCHYGEYLYRHQLKFKNITLIFIS